MARTNTLWRVDFIPDEGKSRVRWSWSEEGANHILNEMLEDLHDGGSAVSRVYPVEIPSTKIGMLDWLRDNLNSMPEGDLP